MYSVPIIVLLLDDTYNETCRENGIFVRELSEKSIIQIWQHVVTYSWTHTILSWTHLTLPWTLDHIQTHTHTYTQTKYEHNCFHNTFKNSCDLFVEWKRKDCILWQQTMAASSVVLWSHWLRSPFNVESKPFEFRSCIRNFSRTLDSYLAISRSYSGREAFLCIPLYL